MAQNIVKNDFTEFGKYIYYIFIVWIVNIIAFFLPIIMGQIVLGICFFVEMILMLLSLGKIKNVNVNLNDYNLNSFYSKEFIGVILRIIGIFIIYFISTSLLDYILIGDYEEIYDWLGTILFGGIICWIGVFFEYKAWSNFENFLMQNQQMFPEVISRDTNDGVNKLKNANLMLVLWFFIITILIGFIFYFVGYFKLGNSLRKLEYNQTEQSQFYHKIIEHPVYNTPSQSVPHFCLKCGSALKNTSKFCPACGAKIIIRQN